VTPRANQSRIGESPSKVTPSSTPSAASALAPSASSAASAARSRHSPSVSREVNPRKLSRSCWAKDPSLPAPTRAPSGSRSSRFRKPNFSQPASDDTLEVRCGSESTTSCGPRYRLWRSLRGTPSHSPKRFRARRPLSPRRRNQRPRSRPLPKRRPPKTPRLPLHLPKASRPRPRLLQLRLLQLRLLQLRLLQLRLLQPRPLQAARCLRCLHPLRLHRRRSLLPERRRRALRHLRPRRRTLHQHLLARRTLLARNPTRGRPATATRCSESESWWVRASRVC
jgi:hypothetical protein